MRVVDAHCHASLAWFEPVEAVLDQMDRHGVEQAVLCQILGLTDNTYLTDCVERHPDRFTMTVMVDHTASNACEELDKLRDHGATGLRLRPTDRSPGADPYAVWRHAGGLGMAVSCCGTVERFASREFAELVAELSDLTIVLEHLGGQSRPDADDAERSMRNEVFQLARFTNVHIKVPGLGEFARRALPPRVGLSPFEEPIPPYLEQVHDAFGAHRMMWGSDHPVVGSREGYGRALELVRQHLASVSKADQRMIFGGTAAQVFGLTA